MVACKMKLWASEGGRYMAPSYLMVEDLNRNSYLFGIFAALLFRV